MTENSNLIWGAPAIADWLNLKGKNEEQRTRKVYHLRRTRKLAGLGSVGNRLVLNPEVTKKDLFKDDLAGE